LRRVLRGRVGRRIPRRLRQRALERLELFLEVVTVAEALAVLLLQQLHDDRLGCLRQIRAQLARARGGRRALHLEQRLAIVRAIRQLPGDHLVEQDAERVEIALRRGVFTARLLGRHVLGRAKHGALGREPRIARECGQSEIEDLHEVAPTTARGQHDVVALEIAVHHAEVVGTREGGAHLLEDVDRARHRHRTLAALVRERLADEVLHHQVELAVLRFAHVVDVDDVRVVDAVGRARLPEHPCSKVRFTTQVRANELQRDDAIDEHVARAVDDAHAPFTKQRLETVATRDDLADVLVLLRAA
jgi:hypothetical protein